MVTKIFERRTLDDLFGPDLDGEIEAKFAIALQEISGVETRTNHLLNADGQFSSGIPAEEKPHVDFFLSTFVLWAQRKKEREKEWKSGFWHVSCRCHRGDGQAHCSSNKCSGQRRPWVTPNRSLMNWMGGFLAGQDLQVRMKMEKARKVLDSLSRMIERISERISWLARLAVDRALSAICDELEKLWDRGPISGGAGTVILTLRDLIGNLRSNRVLAAGGGQGAFILRV